MGDQNRVSDDARVAARRDFAREEHEKSRQIHLRLPPADVHALRRLAGARGQTLSGAVSYLLRKEPKIVGR